MKSREERFEELERLEIITEELLRDSKAVINENLLTNHSALAQIIRNYRYELKRYRVIIQDDIKEIKEFKNEN